MEYSLTNSTIRVSEELDTVPRIWNPHESVGEHTREAIALVDAYIEVVRKYGWNPESIKRLLKIHDIPEILTGDVDPRYSLAHIKHTTEEWAMSLLVSNTRDRDAWHEYAAGETLDAQFAKMFDKLQFLNELIQHKEHYHEYPTAFENYRKHFEPFPEFLEIAQLQYIKVIMLMVNASFMQNIP